MTERDRLDSEMRHVLIQIAVCSHVPAVTYGGGAGSDEHPGGRQPPGDLGPEYFARLYGPPFHTCSRGCKHHKPASNDRDRDAIVQRAIEELKLIRGHGERPRPVGESRDQTVTRMLDECEGWKPEDVERSRWKMSARMVRRYRKIAGLNQETGLPPSDGDGLAASERRARARAYHEQGYRLSQIATLLGVSRSTIERDLEKRVA
jgi:hypothetical protein